jgi:penicillin-binding protein 2
MRRPTSGRRVPGRPVVDDSGPILSRRGALLFGAQALVTGGLAWRLRQLQIEEGDLYRNLAEQNRISIRLLPPARGEIFDREGLPLAVNRQNLRVVVVREQAGDVAAVLDRLARVIPLSDSDRARVLREVSQKAPFVPVTVAEHLDWESFALLNANAPALPGVQPDVGLTRWYPDGPSFSHVIGHVGRVAQSDLVGEDERNPLLMIPDFQIGKNGIERFEERRLRGAAGAQRVEVNAVGRVIREIDRNDGASGQDIRLTIDRGLQRYAMTRMGEESAATVVMDVRNGDILCIASAPGFDPNKFVVGVTHTVWNELLNNDHRPLANKTVSGMYPPGSTFKMVVSLAAMEAGLINANETVFCNGGYNFGDRRFHCWKRGGHGHVNAHRAVKESCDVYYYEIARRVGVDAITAMARRLGLGIRYDLPQTAIAEGLTPTRDWKRAAHNQPWHQGDTLNIGIGQGYMLATPLQLTVMTARLASGLEIWPRLIHSVGGEVAPYPEAPSLGIRRDLLKLMQDGMVAVVNEPGGTALRSRIHDPATGMAGKTGTSQVRRITAAERARGVIRNEDLPWNRRDHALFVGYAPIVDPRYAIAVVVEHGGGGSAAAAPIARDVMMHALYGPEPPLAAYSPAERPEIERRRQEMAAPPVLLDPDAPRDRA